MTAETKLPTLQLEILGAWNPASRERSDCTVRALAAVTAIEYEIAYKLAAEAGRKSGRGFRSEKLLARAKAAGFSFRKVRFGTRTIARFIREHPVGRFYAHTRTHAIAIVDGTPSDRTPLGSILRDAWEFLPAAEVV